MLLAALPVEEADAADSDEEAVDSAEALAEPVTEVNMWCKYT